MSNLIKTLGSTDKLNATRNTNFKIGVDGSDDYGPTSVTGFYNGITPPVGGYTIYVHKASQGPSIHVANDDSQCIFFLKSFGATGSTISEVLNWSTGRTDLWVQSSDLTSGDLTLGIVTSGLQLYLNAGNSSSYPGTGTTWTDLSTNGYTTSTLLNGVGYSTDGGGTLTFDGNNDYVDTNQSLSSEEFTVGAWFKTSAAGIKMILSKETTAGWPWNYRIWLNGGTIVGDVAQSGASNVSISSILTNYNNGNWYNVMFSRNDSTLRLYVNGVEVRNVSDTLTGTVSNSQEVWIGRSAYTGGGASPTGLYPYSGSISEIMIYDRVLTDAEILQNFDATKIRFGL